MTWTHRPRTTVALVAPYSVAVSAISLILFCTNSGFGQGTSQLDCAIATLSLDSPNPEIIRKQPVKQIGHFKVGNPGEEERITRFVKLPQSRWFVVASVYSTDESMPSKSGADSIDLELSLAKKRKRAIFNSPSYASAEIPYGTLDVGRVSMIVHSDRHRQLVVMECKAIE